MVIRHILGYLTKHPDAKDTAQGILRWWLPGGVAEWEEDAVEMALDVLVTRGWLTKRQTTPSPPLFGMNQERLEEIKVFLQKPQRETEGPRE